MLFFSFFFFFFFFNDTATTEIYTLSLPRRSSDLDRGASRVRHQRVAPASDSLPGGCGRDRKSTRLNSSHTVNSYAVLCLKKKQNPKKLLYTINTPKNHNTHFQREAKD